MHASIALALILAQAPSPLFYGLQPGAGSNRSPSPVLGAIDWSVCGDGSTNFPCTAGETTLKPSGGTITVSSDASKCASGSTMVSVSANDLCATSGGVSIFGASGHSNKLTYSRTYDNVAWVPQGAATAVADATLGPDGVGGAGKVYLVTVGNPSNSLYQTVTGLSNSVAFAGELWVKRSSTSGTLSISNPFGAYGALTCDLATFGAEWKRIDLLNPTASGCVSNLVASATGQGGMLFSGSVAVYLANSTITTGTVTGVDVETAGAPVSGNADSASVPVSLTNPAKWAIGIKATPSGGWDRAGTIGLLQWGGSYGAANSVSLYVDTGHKLILEVFDNAGSPDWKRWTSTDALSGTTAKSIVAANNGGTWTLYIDGPPVAGALSGTGTGVQTALPTTNTLNIGTTGSSVLNGYTLKVCQAKDFAGCRKGL